MKRVAAAIKQNRANAIIGVAVFAVVVVALYAASVASAATAQLVPNSTVSSWPSGSYTSIDEGASVTSDAITTGTSGSGGEVARFGVQDLPDVASASSITLRFCANSATNANGGTLDDVAAQIYINGSSAGSSTVTPPYNSSATSCTWYAVNASGGSWNQSAVNSLEMSFTRTVAGGGSPSGRDDNVRVVSAYFDVTYTPSLQIRQSNYRWFDNADSTTPGSALAAQNTAATAPADGQSRLQMLMGPTAGSIDSSQEFKLQYAEKSGTCDPAFSGESYSDIQPIASGLTFATTVTEEEGSVEALVALNESSASGAGDGWLGEDQLFSDNAQSANVASGSSIVSNNLRLSGLATSLPANATVTGFEVEYDTVQSNPYTMYMSLEDGGSVIGTNSKSISSNGIDVIGGTTDTWGAAPTVAELNAGDIELVFNVTSGTGNSISLDYVALRVYYTVPGSAMFYQNTTPANGATAVNGGVTSANTIVLQQYRESNPFTTRSAATLSTNQDGLWDFSLDTSTLDPGSYCFRAVNEDGSPLNSYTQIPEITVPPPTYSQSSYRWYENADSTTPGAPLAGQNTAATIDTGDSVRLRQSVQVDGHSSDDIDEFKLQYGPKVTTCDAASYADIKQTNQVAGWGLLANASGSGPGWYQPSYITGSENGDRAQVLYSYNIDGQLSQFLTVYDYNFGVGVPATATVTGVEASLLGLAFGNTYGSAVAQLSLTDGTTPLPGLTNSQSIANSDTSVTVGGPGDMWGGTISPSDTDTLGVRLRLQLNTVSGRFDDSFAIDSLQLKVYYELDGQEFVYVSNPTPQTGDAISSHAQDPSDGSRTIIHQTYQETDPFGFPSLVGAGQNALWDFSLTHQGTTEGTYCFRAVETDNSPLTSYLQYPELEVGGDSGVTLEQQLRGGQSVVNGTKSPFSW